MYGCLCACDRICARVTEFAQVDYCTIMLVLIDWLKKKKNTVQQVHQTRVFHFFSFFQTKLKFVETIHFELQYLV